MPWSATLGHLHGTTGVVGGAVLQVEVTGRLPFGVISVSSCWIYFVAMCYMAPFNIAWEEVVAGVW